MRICVAGGAGFIGANFIHYMLNKYRDMEIICIDALTYAGNLENLELVKENINFKFYRGDILDKDFLDNIFCVEKFDIVINFAAESHVDRSIENGEVFLQTNIIGTKNLMDMCLKYKVNKFHQISTDEVYGDLDIQSEYLFDEDDCLRPSSPYAVSKASADLLVLSYFRTYGLNVTISRSSNNYGPYQFPEKLIPLVVVRALNDENIPVYGIGENIREWIHVYDHCVAIDGILEKGKSGQVYNVSSSKSVSNISLVKEILDILNKPYSLITFLKDRRGHDLKYAIKTCKLKSIIDFECETEFSKGLLDTVNWYVNNLEWVKTVLKDKYIE